MSGASQGVRAKSLVLVLVPTACALVLSPGSLGRVDRVAQVATSPSFASTLTDVCALVATATSWWLLLSGAVVALVGVRSTPDSPWSRHVQRVAPAAWRRIVMTALGATLLSAPLPAYATSPDPAAQPTVVSGSASPRSDLSGLQLPDRPSGPRRTSPPSRKRTTVTVAPGDCLWSIAERALRARGGTAPAGHREVATATHAWYLANRDAIGPDPDLIRPGMSLTPPLPPDEGSVR